MKPKVFLQDCGIFSNEIIVSAGCPKEEILKYLKKLPRVKKEAIEWIAKEERAFEVFNRNTGATWYDNGRTLLLLGRPKDDWDYWECLIHEISHIVTFMARDKMFENEDECRAYLHEYLFHRIRRKLMGFDKK